MQLSHRWSTDETEERWKQKEREKSGSGNWLDLFTGIFLIELKWQMLFLQQRKKMFAVSLWNYVLEIVRHEK